MSFSYSLVPEAAFGGGSLVAGLLVVIGFLLGLGGVRRRVRRLRHVRERVLVLGESALGRSRPVASFSPASSRRRGCSRHSRGRSAWSDRSSGWSCWHPSSV